jgi:hypothetical protein
LLGQPEGKKPFGGGSLRWKVKVEFTLEQAMKAHSRSRDIALPFLQPRLYIEVEGQGHAPVALSPEKDTVAILQELDGSQGR